MQEGYFKTCWNDIKSTPNWFGKLLLLSLVMLIPIFGPIAVTGYLYGWARDIAWNVQSPMPKHIFGNEDGNQYSRGFFILVQAIVLSFAVSIFQSLWTGITGIGAAGMYDSGMGAAGSFALSGFVGAILIIVLYIAAAVFSWVGAMRIAIYGRLAPGFQFGKMWSMARHDPMGLLRIFGMEVALGVIVGVIASVLWTLFAGISVGGLLVAYPTTDGMYSTSGRYDLGLALLIILLMIAVVVVFTMPLAVFTEVMVARALGYWTRQFDVAHWRGQDEPMPHEINGGSAANMQQAAPVAPTSTTPTAANAAQQPYAAPEQQASGQQAHGQQQFIQKEIPQDPVFDTPVTAATGEAEQGVAQAAEAVAAPVMEAAAEVAVEPATESAPEPEPEPEPAAEPESVTEPTAVVAPEPEEGSPIQSDDLPKENPIE